MPEQIKQITTKDKEYEFTSEEQAKIDNYKTYIAKYSNFIATVKVPYDDLSILLRPSSELEFVDKFFSDITCEDKGIERLLYEVIGYSLFKTSKLNKAIILKGLGRNGKSKIFRIIETL